MGRSPARKRNRNNNSSPVATIQAFTESAERIGVDAAIYGTIAIIGFAALAFGAHAGGVFGFAAILVVGWNATKFINSYFTLRKALLKLEGVRQERGQPLLRMRREHPAALSLIKEEQGNDAQR